MKIKLHHVNFCSTDVPALETFYRDVLDLEPERSLEAGRILDKAGLSRCRRLPLRRHHPVPPGGEGPGRQLSHGPGNQPGRARPHRLPHRRHRGGQEAVKEKGIAFSDYGAWAMKGWEQIFFYDPDGNVIEVHQVRE